MAREVLTYSPSDVKITLSGYTLGGIVSIDLTWNTAPMQIRRGIRGQNTRIFNRDLSASISVEVLQTSVTNEVLFQILRLDRRNQVARLDLALSDNSGRSVLQTNEAYIAAYPPLSYSMGFNTRKWVIEILGVTDGTLAGSANQEVDFFSSIAGAGLLSNAAGFI